MNFRSYFVPHTDQQGNTFIGIIIGLVIGLVIAVVVALIITKGPTPFTDKGHSSKPAEPTAGQLADPNKPMYSNKEKVHEVAKDFIKEPAKALAPDPLQSVVDKIQSLPGTPAVAPTPPPAPKTVAASLAAPAMPSASNITPAPLPKAVPTARGAESSGDNFIYYLQAGAFREQIDAESVRAKLVLLGFEATVSERAHDTGMLHHVRLGPFNQVETMNKVRSKLSENGIDVAVVRNQK